MQMNQIIQFGRFSKNVICSYIDFQTTHKANSQREHHPYNQKLLCISDINMINTHICLSQDQILMFKLDFIPITAKLIKIDEIFILSSSY